MFKEPKTQLEWSISFRKHMPVTIKEISPQKTRIFFFLVRKQNKNMELIADRKTVVFKYTYIFKIIPKLRKLQLTCEE